MKKEEKFVIDLYSLYLNNKKYIMNIKDLKLDIEEIYRISQSHQIFPMIYHVIKDTELLLSQKKEIVHLWKSEAYNTIINQTKKEEHIWPLYKKIIDAGIKVLIIKGATLRIVYPHPHYRWSSDEDMWISIDDFKKCLFILLQNGFAPVNVNNVEIKDKQEVSFFNPQNNVYLELHLNPIGIDVKTRAVLNEQILKSFDNTREYKYGNNIFYSLDITENLIYIFCHLLKHFLFQGASLRMVTDVLLYMKYYSDKIDYEKLKMFLSDNNFTVLFESIIKIGTDYLDFKFDFIDIKNTNPDVEDLLYDIISGGVVGTFSEEREKSHFVTGRVMSDIKNGKQKMFLKTVFPSYKTMKIYYPKLKRHKILLPYYWFIRILRLIFKSNYKLMYKSYKSGLSRVKLFEKYNIV